MAKPTTYSFKDLSGAFAHPLAGDFPFAGQIGMHQVTVRMTQEKTSIDVASDGAPMVSYQSGDIGSIDFECQQTSDFHKFMLYWYNLIKTAADAGDPSDWASASVTMRNIVDGSTHIGRGVAPNKIPDKVYAARGGNITWSLVCAEIQSITV